MRIPDRVREWRPDRVVTAAWALTILPVMVAAARAVHRGWLPIGDDALVAIRAQDVLTSHHPWLGTWSSASLDAGKDLNHPGPLLFDSVAPTVKLFGGHGGLAVGVMLVNILAITTVAVFAWRRGGRITALPMLLGTSVLCFVMGSELLFDPWNPHILILPCLALLVCAWGISSGDRWAFVVYLAIGSYCMQTHLGYAYLVPGVLVVSMAIGGLRRRWPNRRTWGIAAGVVLVLWAQPLAEQMFGSGEGNLARILGARGSGGPTVGVRLATRLLASVLVRAPWNWRTGFIDAAPNTPYSSPGILAPVPIVAGFTAVVLLLLLGAAVAVLLVMARRRGDEVSIGCLVTAGGAVTVAWLSMVIMPIGPLGLSAHQMRWMWSIWAFLGGSLVCACWRAVAGGHRRQRIVERSAIGALVLVAAASLPSYVQMAGTASQAYQIPSVAVLDSQLGPLEGIGTVYFDSSNTPAFDGYSAAVLAELQRRGVPFVVSEPRLVRQLGNARQFHPGGADVRMQLRYGPTALMVPKGLDRVALYSPLTPAELSEFDSLVSAGDSMTAAERDRFDVLGAKGAAGAVAVVISAAT